jgi:alanine dehydrogenase
MRKNDFRISVVADISCDVNGPIPCSIRASTIADPFYSFNPSTGAEEPAFSRASNVTVMAVDNLPGELPREASQDFGKQLMQKVLYDLLMGKDSRMIKRATITENGKLSPQYAYLEDYVNPGLF